MGGMRRSIRSLALLGIVSCAAGISRADIPPGSVDQTLVVVRDCLSKTSGSWPQAWQDQYVETIRRAIVSDRNLPSRAERLRILREGFPSFWKGQTPAQGKATFQVQCAQIRFYIESLMDASLPDEADRKVIRDQWRVLWDQAAASLLRRFSFLDPNTVQQAKADHLAQCYRDIETPLLPVFSKRFTEKQVDQIKQRWDDLRYARIDLWRQLADRHPTISDSQNQGPVEASLDYVLTQKSLDMFRGHVAAIVTPASDYYRQALRDRAASEKQRLKAVSLARNEELRLRRQYSKQLWQSGYLAFVLTALLETADEYAGQAPDASQEGGQ